jgi:hypothetical protein
VIALGCEIVGTRGALFLGLVAEAFEHEGRGPPDVDFGYHGAKVIADKDAVQRQLAFAIAMKQTVKKALPFAGSGLRFFGLARATEAAALHGNNWAVLGGIDFCAFEWDGPCDARKIVVDRNAPRVCSRARRCRYLNYSLETLWSNLASNFTVLQEGAIPVRMKTL